MREVTAQLFEERKSTIMKSKKPVAAPMPLRDALHRMFEERCFRRVGLLILVGLQR